MGRLPKLLSDIRGAISTLWPNSNLRRLLVDRRGAVAVIVAIAATALIGFTALGVETGLWYTIKRQAQSAADAAALSGAYERAAGQTYSDICAKAENEAAANGFTFSSFTCPSTSPACTSPSSGQMCANNPPVGSTDDKYVEVILAQQQQTFLANLFLPSVTIGTPR
jgi:Flp pilus assembly protein TadG